MGLVSRAGQASAVGDVFRAEVSTFLAVHALGGRDVADLALPSGTTAQRVEFETDDPTDDVRVTWSDGRRAYVSAKRASGNDAAFRDTVGGWLAQLPGLGRDDLLVLAVEQLRGVLSQLGPALSRVRGGQEVVRPAEQRALDALDALVPAELQADVRRRARVLVVPHSTASELGRSLLEAVLGYVLADGDARGAVAVLADDLARQAGRAGSSTLEDWVRTLHDTGHPVVLDQGGPAGMRAAAQAAALDHYRAASLADRGRIDLTLLAEDLPPVAVPGLLDGVRVVRGDEDRSRGEPLLRYVRRWGRLLLVGQPGAGKSVALRELAVACVEHPAAPLPVRVALPQLLEHYPGPLPADALLASALDMVPAVHRLALAEGLTLALAGGRVLLLCDGLDECGSRAPWVASRLAEAVAELHPDVGLVVATRANGVPPARHLGLPQLDLQPPDDLSDTLVAVLEACAVRRVREPEREAWVAGRTAWLTEARDQHGGILDVPLLAVLAALTCADTPAAQLPRHRALVLHEAVRQSVNRWERTRTSADAGRPWSLDLSQDVLLGGFVELGRLLDSGATPSREEVSERLVAWLAEAWGFAPARAREVARDVVRFWDDHVAVFVFDSADRLRSRSKVFAEIATAMWAQSCSSEELAAWLAETVPWTDSDGAIALAAGLDRRTTTALLELGDTRDAATLLVSELAVDGAVTLEPDEARRCLEQIGALVDVVAGGGPVPRRTSRMPEEPLGQRQGHARCEPAWRLVERACRLPLAPNDRAFRGRLLANADLGAESAAVASALAALTDAVTDVRELTEDEVAQVQAVAAAPLPPGAQVVQESRHRIAFANDDPAHPGLAPVALLAVGRHTKLGADTPRWAFDVSMRAAYGLGSTIRAALHDAGVNTRPWWRETWRFDLSGIVAEGKEHERLLLEDIAALDPTPALDDSHPSLWSLAELGDLLLAAELTEQGVRARRRAFEDDSASLRRGWLGALCDAYGLAKPVVAAQARHLMSAAAPDADRTVAWDDWRVATAERPLGDVRPRLVPDAVTEAQQRVLLECLEASSGWLAWPAATVLINVLEPVWSGAELAARDLHTRSRGRSALVLAVGMLTAGEQSQELVAAAARSGDADRRVAARIAITVNARLDPHGHLRATLGEDPDLAVRPENSRHLHPTCRHWSCDCCRLVNALDVEDCPGCATGSRPR